MKRLLQMLLILCLFYLLIQLGFKYLGNGHTVNYEIKGNDYTIKVKEQATFNHKNEVNNYYFTFTVNQTEFYFQTYQTFKKNDYVVKDVKYFKNDNYECIYPIFKNHEQVTDILCKVGAVTYNYHDLKGKSGELDKFAKDMEQEGYDANYWIDNKEEPVKDELGPIVVYPKNIVESHYVGVDNYSGIYLINNYLSGKSLYKITIFQKDAYERIIDGRAGRFYIVADYNEKHDFNTFYLVDMVYNDQKTIKYHTAISFDSYIQGTVDNSIYIFDRSNKKQFKVDAKAGNVAEVGNEETGIKYYNLGKWETRKAVEAVTSNLYFNEYQVEPVVGYERIDKVGNELSGYYYYYKKVGKGYEVYRSNVQNKDHLTYLFKTSDISEIQYLNDYVYFKEGLYVKYYHDMTGVRTLLLNTEFEFNHSLHYYTYYTNK